VTQYVAWLLFACTVAVGVYDIYASQSGGGLETVSAYAWRISREYPILPFIAGIVIGHLFWPNGIHSAKI
jgi:hypothetical protein